MINVPVASPQTEGRIFGTDWSIANVAKLLRSNAARGLWRQTVAAGSSMGRVNQNYLRTVSARHLPTAASLIFLQLEAPGGWYASLCFTDGEQLLPWNHDTAGLWLDALFGEDRHRATEITQDPDAATRQFLLAF
jgi:hypothetical protein